MAKNKARFWNKVKRKLHTIVYFKLCIGPWATALNSSYRHRHKVAKNDDLSTLYITFIPNEGAGIGHQIAEYCCGLRFAMMLGVNYAYPGFYGKEDWEEFLGLSSNTTTIDELKKQGYKLKNLPVLAIDEIKNLKVLDDKKPSFQHWYEDNRLIDNNLPKVHMDIDMTENTLQSLKDYQDILRSYAGKKIIFCVNTEMFYQNQYEVIPYIKPRFESAPARKKDRLIYNPVETNIAVHIRRGDINIGQQTGEKTLTKRWLDMGYYENVVKDLTASLSSPYRIFIFSEGDADEYRIFENYGPVTYCFDMSAMDSFLHMVRADYLVLSKSSFSYKPALLADGVRICAPGFWHGYPDDPKWIIADGDGHLSENQLENIG